MGQFDGENVHDRRAGTCMAGYHATRPEPIVHMMRYLGIKK
jgi:hypothetical protein